MRCTKCGTMVVVVMVMVIVVEVVVILAVVILVIVVAVVAVMGRNLDCSGAVCLFWNYK